MWVTALVMHHWLLFALFFAQRPGPAEAQTWWSSVATLGTAEVSGGLCARLPGLSPGQARICQLFLDHMPAVGSGARTAIEACQSSFASRLWNCSSAYGNEVFGPRHPLGTAEAAFTHGILSAGVTAEVARRCRLGQLLSCGCSEAQRPKNLHHQWNWGGCGDNVEYGYEFARNFIDVREREESLAAASAQYARALMNRWNNEVGRKLVRRRTSPTCKCHGVSGSCNLKTCWRQLPSFKRVSKILVDKYDSAKPVKVNRRGNLQLDAARLVRAPETRRRKSVRKGVADLVYLDESPNYCEANLVNGTLGTSGRPCSNTGSGAGSCDALCCGRGYRTLSEVVREKCECEFVWCCRVVCKTCVRRLNTHICR